MTDYVGTSGDDSIAGTNLADTFDLSQGGDDTADGKGGNDVFDMGGAFTSADRLIGGDGNDLVVLEGDYSAGAVYSLDRFSTIERVAFEAGHDYRLNVVGTTLGFAIDLQSHIGADDHLIVDGRRIEGGVGILFEGGDGHETILGSGGFDTVYMHGGLTADDRINGGGGANDHLYLDGDYSAGLVMRSGTVGGFEFMHLAAGNDYDLTFAKGTVGGLGMDIDARGLDHTDTVSIDAHKLAAGALSIESGAGNDTLIGAAADDSLSGGKGQDRLTGGGGADRLEGGLGGDRFIFLHTSDTTVAAHDLIADYDPTGDRDRIDLKHIDADTTQAGNQAFHLVAALDGHAGELAQSYDAGSDLTSIVGDVDGDGVADLMITVTGDHTAESAFVL